MAPAPDPKVNVTRADQSGEDRMAMFRELAKHTKPTGPSAKGKSIDGSEEE